MSQLHRSLSNSVVFRSSCFCQSAIFIAHVLSRAVGQTACGWCYFINNHDNWRPIAASSCSYSCNSWYLLFHDDVIKWKRFPRYWPFVRGIHRSPVNSPHKGQWRRALIFSLDQRPNKRLSKQSWGWWFETPSRPLWRHCNVFSTAHLGWGHMSVRAFRLTDQWTVCSNDLLD